MKERQDPMQRGKAPFYGPLPQAMMHAPPPRTMLYQIFSLLLEVSADWLPVPVCCACTCKPCAFRCLCAQAIRCPGSFCLDRLAGAALASCGASDRQSGYSQSAGGLVVQVAQFLCVRAVGPNGGDGGQSDLHPGAGGVWRGAHGRIGPDGVGDRLAPSCPGCRRGRSFQFARTPGYAAAGCRYAAWCPSKWAGWTVTMVLLVLLQIATIVLGHPSHGAVCDLGVVFLGGWGTLPKPPRIEESMDQVLNRRTALWVVMALTAWRLFLAGTLQTASPTGRIITGCGPRAPGGPISITRPWWRISSAWVPCSPTPNCGCAFCGTAISGGEYRHLAPGAAAVCRQSRCGWQRHPVQHLSAPRCWGC